MENIICELSNLQEVEAIMSGGSRATENFDEHSDYDLYVYLNSSLDEEKRRIILEKYCSYMEYSNHFWELEDDGVLKNGIEIELIYRNISDIDDSLDALVNKGQVSHGYSTCFLDNLLKSKVLFDKNDRINELRKKYQNGLNEQLLNKIIEYNAPIILDRLPAIYKQVEKAVKRNDIHSINHRLTEYFSIFYDILFAINHKTHPGEKRLLEYATKLDLLPKNYKKYIDNIFRNVFHNNTTMLDNLKHLSINLLDLLKEMNLYY